MLGHRDITLEDVLSIAKRRLWLLVIPVLAGPVIGLGLAKVLPKKFESQTLVLVQDPSVPNTFVAPIVNDQLNQWLGTMGEQILSRSRLQPIIERFGLYQGENAGGGLMEELVVQLRKSVVVTPVQPVGRGQNQDLQGFRIGVTLYDARLAQQVCAEITSMFMEENLKRREQKAQSTTDFLQTELILAKAKLDDQDRKLAEFKQRFSGQLPGQEQMIMNLLLGSSTQLEAATQALNRAQQDKTYYQSVLAQAITAWEASKAGTNPVSLEQQLDALKSRLITLEGQYTQNHPDVVRARTEVAQLEKKIEDAKVAGAAKPVSTAPSSILEPANIQQLRGQIHTLETIILEKTKEQQRLQAQIKTYEARLQLSPVVEQQYKDLTRDHQTALASYNDLLQKRTQSEIATNLERTQQGQTFRIMDQANLPSRPTFPDPLMFTGGGLAAGFALGVGLALLLEFRDKSLRTESDIEALLGIPTLALIPVVDELGPKKTRAWGFRKRAAA